jgi:hypothetical protein
MWQIQRGFVGGTCRSPRVLGQPHAFLSTDQNQAFTMLRNAEVRSVKHLPRQPDNIAGFCKRSDKLVQEGAVPPDRQALYVLEDKCLSAQFAHEPHKFQNKRIARIIKDAMTDQREALTWRSTEHAINLLIANSGGPPDLRAGNLRNAFWDNCAIRKIEFVNSTMDRLDLHRGDYVKPRLLEPKRHSPSARKQVNSNRPRHRHPKSIRYRH